VQEHGARPPLRRRLSLVGAVALVVVAVDQATKAWAAASLDDRDIDLVGSLRLHLERNSGGAFSLNEGRGGLVAVAALVVVVVLLWYGRTAHTWPGALAVGLVLGGAVGNLVDRVVRDGSGFLGGRVVDFIDLQWWPVFNVADMAVTIGGVLLVLVSTREPAREPTPTG
jgi:signal peptidase II